MKKSGLKNSFDRDDIRYYYCYNYKCFWCGKNHADAFHHIYGRESASLLNSCPINNNECHLYNPQLTKDKVKKKLALLTFRYLDKEGFVPGDIDKKFIQKHMDIYKGLEIGGYKIE
jgi:hypothetical protein